MRGQYRYDQRSVQHLCGLCGPDALRAEEVQRGCQRAPVLGGRTLPILSQIRQHRKQHEAAYKGDRLVERQALQPSREAPWVRDTAIAVDGCRANGLDALKECIATVRSNHISQQFPKESNIGVLRDGE